jgi:tetratricopeptide (TPR) repeat protein
MALLWQHKACFEDALIEARAGLELFPRDGLLQLTAGCVLEERAILFAPREKDDGPGDVAKEWLKDAQRDFTDAVANDPDLILARVRLGRVLWRLGQADASRQTLEAALPRAREPDHRYLAHLFLGRLHEDAQRRDEAVAAYRQAVLVYPQAQSAAVALAHALQLAGRADEARQALAEGVADLRRLRDPYSDYLAGNTEGADRLEAALHREALE